MENDLNIILSEKADENLKEIDSILANYSDNFKPRFSDFGNRVRISSLLNPQITPLLLNKTVTVCGWIRTTRVLGKGDYLFAEVNDGSCVKHLQVVVLKHIDKFEELKNEGIGSSVRFKGVVVQSQGSKQSIELVIQDNNMHKLTILGKCDLSNYELVKTKDKIKLEKLREIAHLRPRTNIIGCITRIRSNLALATHHFFQSLNFLYVNTPIITQTDCESVINLFQVTTLLEDNIKDIPIKDDNSLDFSKDFFKVPVYLTCSAQLELETYACALSDVYSFGPTFRAEVNLTPRHLAEFWMVECEICFAGLCDIMDLAEKYVKFCLRYILNRDIEDLEYIRNHYENSVIENITKIINSDFARTSYTEAIDILIDASVNSSKKGLFKDAVTWGIALSPEHEKYLSDIVFKTPVFIYNFPRRVKSFYMRVNEDNETVASFDLLIPKIGEIIGGSVREDRVEILKFAIDKEYLEDRQKYESYLDLRKYGTVPHSGFGMGFDRLVMVATGMKDVKDVTPYPRYPNYSEC